MKWFRSYHGMADDPKIIAIGLEIGVHRCFVLGVWQVILEHASAQEDRGSIAGLTARTIGTRLNMDFPQVESILGAMRRENMIDGYRVVAWVKRQKPSDDVARKVAGWRREKKQAGNGAETQESCTVTQNEKPTNVPLQSAECTVTFRQTLKIDSESTNVDSSPPIPPTPETISPSAQSAVADVSQTSLPALFDPPAESLPAKHTAVPYAEAAEIWNNTCGDLLPKISKWPKGRASAFAKRFKNDCKGNLEVWRDVCNRVRASDFCCGNSDRAWRADIDFALQESSWVKITEGKYDNVKSTNKPNSFSFVDLMARIEARNRSEQDDNEFDRKFGPLPALSWQDGNEAPTTPRSGGQY